MRRPKSALRRGADWPKKFAYLAFPTHGPLRTRDRMHIYLPMIGTPRTQWPSSYPRTSSSPLARAWVPIDEAGSWWARVREPFAKRRYGTDFERFRNFVAAFPADRLRPLRPDEDQEMADDAVLLRLLDVDRTFRTPDSRPNFYELVAGYRRRSDTFSFREWLIVHERRFRGLQSQRH